LAHLQEFEIDSWPSFLFHMKGERLAHTLKWEASLAPW